VSGEVVGVLTRNDMIKALREGGPQVPVTAVMRPDVPSVPLGASFEHAFRIMSEAQVPAVIVRDAAGQVVGVITPENVGEMMMVRAALGDGATAPAGSRPATWARRPAVSPRRRRDTVERPRTPPSPGLQSGLGLTRLLEQAVGRRMRREERTGSSDVERYAPQGATRSHGPGAAPAAHQRQARRGERDDRTVAGSGMTASSASMTRVGAASRPSVSIQQVIREHAELAVVVVQAVQRGLERERLGRRVELAKGSRASRRRGEAAGRDLVKPPLGSRR
jgi:hypothetical protein